MGKKSIFVCCALLLCASMYAQSAERDFETDGTGTITTYKGWDTAVVIPASIGGKPVTAIGESAFASNDLTSVTIPDTVKTIGKSAFAKNKLAHITIGRGVTSIGNGAFSGNPIVSLTIPDGVNIGGYAFSLNKKSTSITLGKNIIVDEHTFTDPEYEYSYVGNNIFYDYACNDRKAGVYTADIRQRYPDEDGDFEYIKTKYGACITGYSGSSGNRLQIPDTVGGLAVKAITGFYGKNIGRVRIPNSVSYIGNNAFSQNLLTEITIPDSVTYIGSTAFYNNQLISATIGNGVISIGDQAFSENYQLASVTMGSSVTFIGTEAFCRSNLTSVTIPNSVTTISASALVGNKLTSITIGAHVTMLDGYYTSFPGEFDSLYNKNGKKAGTYTRKNADSEQWTYAAR